MVTSWPSVAKSSRSESRKGQRMLRLRCIAPGEKDKWNAFAESSGMGAIYHTFEWGAFKERDGWQPKRYVLETREGDFQAILPILVKPLGPFGSVWYLPRGPVCNYKDTELTSNVFDALVDLAVRNRAVLLKVSPDPGALVPVSVVREMLRSKGFHETTSYQLHKCTIRVDLTPDLEAIFMDSVSSNTRSKIRRARRKGVVVRSGSDEADLQSFYDLYCQALAHSGNFPLTYRYFKDLFSELSQYITLLIAEDRKGPLASILLVTFAKRCWYLFGGTTRERDTKYASQLLHWEAIKRAKLAGLEYYDLQGIPCNHARDHALEGIYHFKRGFSPNEIELVGEFDFSTKPRLSSFLQDTVLPLYRQVKYCFGNAVRLLEPREIIGQGGG